MSQKTAIITGITGQDASYLSELLLGKGYKVFGMKRRSSVDTTERIDHLLSHPGFELFDGDITDATGIFRSISKIQPDELYNLAAQSDVGISFDEPVTTLQIDAVGPLNLLEAIRQCSPHTRFYQASSSEMFGNPIETPQTEDTPLLARSPYGAAKIAAHNLVRVYREAYGLFTCGGILFNHESPRRGENFVTRKITLYVAALAQAILEGKASYENPLHWNVSQFRSLELGNLSAQRDWSHARDAVRAMWMMLQQDQPEDFVIASGETHSIGNFLHRAFLVIGLPWKPFVVPSTRFMRPADIHCLVGDSTKARNILGWRPRVSFDGLIYDMVESDLAGLGLTIDGFKNRDI